VSQENVEVVTRIIASFNAGDVLAAAEGFHPDAEWRDLSHAPDTPELLVGVEAIVAVAGQWAQAFDEFGAEVYEYIDAEPWVICDTRWYGTGRGSTVGVDIHQADAYEVKAGKVARAVLAYPDAATALKAVGLEE
jgi:ketosteroid isomerase-like protein